jgi:hypothetical protein
MDRRAGLGSEARRSSGGEVTAAPVILRRASAALVLVLLLAAAGCSTENAAKSPDPQAVLQGIPPADSAQYDRIRDMSKWRNPYLIVRADGVALFDSADSAEIILKTDELLPALARLPAAKWPYGRVVAVAEDSAKGDEQERVAIRRNRGIVGGMLEGARVAVKWVPAG